MNNRLLGALGGVSALALLSGSAVASPSTETVSRVQPAQSFGELLDPIPDAVNTLKAEDAINASHPIQVAQLYFGVGHHHHHHNFYYHHHHHFRPMYPGFGFYRRYHHHHHHFFYPHHHHHHFYGY
jgi:hypothetical protein